MERMKKWFSKWALALLATLMVLTGLAGCSSKDVETALDVAIEVIEVVESLEAMETETQISSGSEQTSVQTEAQTTSEAETEAIETEDEAAVIDEDGHYTSKEEVALYLYTYGKLPSNFITKKEAENLGWKKKDGEAGQLHVVAPGMSIGGSSFGNYEGLLPEKKGRKYFECDINYVKGNRGAERLVYSNDGLIFYTGDHYESFDSYIRNR
jgi:hypothetical protein